MKIQARFSIPRDPVLNFEFSIENAGIMAIAGKSGCGKTSLLRAIAGLEKHAASRLLIDDEIWQDDSYFLPVHQRGIGYVFQEASLFEHLSVKSNIEYGMKRTPTSSEHISLQTVIGLLELETLLHKKPAHLSGGERQRVAIARALAANPRLVLMDEPLASLDQHRKENMLNYIESFNRQLQIPVIYVSHASDEIARLASLMIFIEDATVKAAGPIEELLTRSDLSLAHRRDAESVIHAHAQAYDEEFHLNHLASRAGTFLVPGKKLPESKAVKLRLAAQDVSITLQKQHETSILNCFSATIDELIEEDNAQLTVRLLINETPILARITLKSARALNLQKGKQVFAQIKSVAVLA